MQILATLNRCGDSVCRPNRSLQGLKIGLKFDCVPIRDLECISKPDSAHELHSAQRVTSAGLLRTRAHDQPRKSEHLTVLKLDGLVVVALTDCEHEISPDVYRLWQFDVECAGKQWQAGSLFYESMALREYARGDAIA